MVRIVGMSPARPATSSIMEPSITSVGTVSSVILGPGAKNGSQVPAALKTLLSTAITVADASVPVNAGIVGNNSVFQFPGNEPSLTQVINSVSAASLNFVTPKLPISHDQRNLCDPVLKVNDVIGMLPPGARYLGTMTAPSSSVLTASTADSSQSFPTLNSLNGTASTAGSTSLPANSTSCSFVPISCAKPSVISNNVEGVTWNPELIHSLQKLLFNNLSRKFQTHKCKNSVLQKNFTSQLNKFLQWSSVFARFLS
jgi:hypothetical protein